MNMTIDHRTNAPHILKQPTLYLIGFFGWYQIIPTIGKFVVLPFILVQSHSVWVIEVTFKINKNSTGTDNDLCVHKIYKLSLKMMPLI